MRPTDLPASISAALELQWQTRPDSICMIFLSGNDVVQEVTGRQLQAAVYHYASVLRTQRIVPGDLVALAFNHTWELIPAFLGAIHLGAVPVILPYLNTISGERLEKQVRQMMAAWQVRAVVTLPHYLPAFDFLETAGCPVVALPAPDETGGEAVPACGRGSDETAYLQLSSGTTGEPKATIIPHRALLNSVQTMLTAWNLTEQDVSVGWLPLHHDMGLIFQVFTPLLGGFLSVLIAPDYWVRRPRSLMQAVHRYRGTWTGMPNFAFNHCVHAIRDGDMIGLDLSSWRLLLNGAELIYLNSLQMFYDRFAPYGLRHECLRAVYGMTENVGAISLTPPLSAAQPWLVDWVAAADLVEGGCARPMPAHHPEARPIVNCGRLLPGNELKIAAADGSALPDRRVGEVWLRSHSLCPEYYRLENGHIPQAGGWFPTGDIGYLVNDELFICDRKKDIIISAGNHIFPGVIEPVGVEVLGERAGGMAAFGVSSAELGTELPVLVGEVRGKVDEADRIGWIAAIRQQVHRELGITLADVQLVRRGWLVQTTSAKIARTACRQKYLAEFAPAKLETHPRVPRPNLNTSFVSPRPELEQQLAGIWAELLNLDEVGVEDNFFELGGDSLAAVRMLLQVEKYAKTSVPYDFFRNPTLTNLAEQLSRPSDTPPHAIPQPNINRPRNGYLWPRITNRLLVEGPIWKGQPVLPYTLGTRLQCILMRHFLAGSRVLKAEVKLFTTFRETAGISDPKNELLLLSLMSNIWRTWRTQSLQSPANFNRYVKLTGIEHLQKALEKKNGLLIVFAHQTTPSVKLAHYWLETQGFSGSYTLVGTLGQNGPEMRPVIIERTRKAHDCLQRDGIVFIAGDGRTGEGGINIPFYGRLLPLRYGFSRLALENQTPITALFSYMTMSGQITLEFFPLSTPTNNAEADELLHNYARLLTACWPKLLPTMSWGRLMSLATLPKTEETYV